MKTVNIMLAVEDELSETVAKKILNQCAIEYKVSQCIGKKGFGYLKSRIDSFNNAAKKLPFLVITDQDGGCPIEKIKKWFNGNFSKNLIFRIAINEIESWVLADKDAFSNFASVSVVDFPIDLDEIIDPKQFLLNKIKKSKIRVVKQSLLPEKGSTSKVGPDYNGVLSDFVRNEWNVHRAINNSQSLRRAFRQLNEKKWDY